MQDRKELGLPENFRKLESYRFVPVSCQISFLIGNFRIHFVLILMFVNSPNLTTTTLFELPKNQRNDSLDLSITM